MTPTIEDVASRIVKYAAEKCLDSRCIPGTGVIYFVDCAKLEAFVAAELAALAESRDALLRECRAIVQDRKGAWEIVDKTFHQYATERARTEQADEVSKCTDLLARIDAVLEGSPNGE